MALMVRRPPASLGRARNATQGGRRVDDVRAVKEGNGRSISNWAPGTECGCERHRDIRQEGILRRRHGDVGGADVVVDEHARYTVIAVRQRSAGVRNCQIHLGVAVEICGCSRILSELCESK